MFQTGRPSSVRSDLKYAIRQARKSPGFTAIAVLILGLGIGVSIAVFTLFDAILLRALPVRDPKQLVLASNGTNRQGGERFSYPTYELLRDQAESLVGLIASTRDSTFLIASGLGQSNGMPVAYTAVSGNFFSILGVPAFFGRTLESDDDRKDAPRAVVVLSYSLWQGKFGSDLRILGKTVLLKNVPFEVVGIARPGFFGFEPGAAVDLWMPIHALPLFSPPWSQILQSPRASGFEIIGRLRPEVKRDVAGAELDTIYQAEGSNIGIPTAERGRDWGKLNLVPGGSGRLRLGPDFRGGGIRQVLFTLMGVVSLVLAICCANVGGLLLVRTIMRRREFAVRAALGAARSRLVRQLMMEGLLLAFAGGLLGLLVMHWLTDALASYFVGQTDSSINLSPDASVVLFAVAVSMITGIVIALIPILRFKQSDLVSAFKNQAHTSAGGSHQWTSEALVVAQIGISVCLLASASLLIRSLQGLKNVDLGFNRENLLFFSVGFPGYDGNHRANLEKEILAALETLPGVRSATVSGRGLSGGQVNSVVPLSMSVEGYVPRRDEKMEAYLATAGPRFFADLGIPLVRGREFGFTDVFPTSSAASIPIPTVVISESIARRFFGNTDPVGRHISCSSFNNAEIIGVARDIKFASLRDDSQLVIYVPSIGSLGVPMALRTTGAPLALAQSVRAVIKRIDPNAPIQDLRTMEDVLDQQLAKERTLVQVAKFCSAFALILACLGLYALLSYNVTRRTHEIGVRMALGARAADIVSLIVRQAMWLAVSGSIAGVAGAVALTRFIASSLYGVTGTDPLTLIGTAVTLVAVALFACWLPAWRATRVDPLIALRAE